MAYTTTELLAAIKHRAQIPDANGALSNDDLLSLATLAMRTQIQPLIRSVREDFAVVRQTIPLVADQRQYAIPSRAEGGSVRDVWIRQIAAPERAQRLPYIPPEERPIYEQSRNVWWDSIFGYTVEGNDLWLMPTPGTAEASDYELEVRYVLRPGRFVATNTCDVVSSWTSPTITTASASVFTTGDDVDVIGAKPPFRPRILDSNTTVAGSLVTVSAADVIEAPVAGDYVCATDTTCVVTCPVEAYEALISATLVEVYAVLGYQQDMAAAVSMRDNQMQAVRVLMEPRTQGAARVVIDPRSPLRRGRRMGWW